MLSQKNICLSQLISPKINHYNENQKKNENPWSDKILSVKPIIRPQPLNLNIINEINGKSMNKKGELLYEALNIYGNHNNPKLSSHEKYFPK